MSVFLRTVADVSMHDHATSKYKKDGQGSGRECCSSNKVLMFSSLENNIFISVFIPASLINY
jgi:hypothetical protein